MIKLSIFIACFFTSICYSVPAALNNSPYATPFHFYTGFTPVGLEALVQLAGFKILHICQFGNFEYLNLLLKTHAWPDYAQLKRPGINEFENPVITWIFAVKS